ncbi:MAG: hypothetical protein Q9181_001504 [Wetmoreana brouardii]
MSQSAELKALISLHKSSKRKSPPENSFENNGNTSAVSIVTKPDRKATRVRPLKRRTGGRPDPEKCQEVNSTDADVNNNAAEVRTSLQPWKNPLMNSTHFPNSKFFDLRLPEGKDGKAARVYLYVHKRLEKEKVSYKAPSRDVITISIELDSPPDPNRKHILRIHNIYNELKIDLAPALELL